jgi:hypothetical protein
MVLLPTTNISATHLEWPKDLAGGDLKVLLFQQLTAQNKHTMPTAQRS